MTSDEGSGTAPMLIVRLSVWAPVHQSRRILAGLRSRWITPRWWAYSTASADPANQIGGLPGREWALGRSLGQALSLDKTHRKKMLALVLSDLVSFVQLATHGRQLGPQRGLSFLGEAAEIIVNAPVRAPFRQSASKRRQTASMWRTGSMSKPPRLSLGRSLISWLPGVGVPRLAERLSRIDASTRQRCTLRKMSVSRAIVTSLSEFGTFPVCQWR